MAKRLAILGGTFDPIHNGHLAVAQLVVNKLYFERLIFIPNNIQPHRSAASASSDDRLAMLQLALNTTQDPKFTINTCELERPGPSYMVDTITEICSLNPEFEPWLILGLDTFYTLPTWHNFPKLINSCNFVVVNRSFIAQNSSQTSWANHYLKNNKIHLNDLADFKNFTNTKDGAVILLENEAIDISSTKIRALIQQASSINDTQNEQHKQNRQEMKNTLNNLLPLPVIDYILARNLYT